MCACATAKRRRKQAAMGDRHIAKKQRRRPRSPAPLAIKGIKKG